MAVQKMWQKIMRRKLLVIAAKEICGVTVTEKQKKLHDEKKIKKQKNKRKIVKNFLQQK